MSISTRPQSNQHESIDTDKIDTAVRFLRNPNVSKTDKERKIQFLHSKGLSDNEIEIALQKASEFDKSVAGHEDSNGWHFFDYAKGLVLGAGLLAAVNYAYKAYILPYIAHEMKDDGRIENLTEGLQALQDEMKQNTYELNATLKNIQTLLEEHQKLLINLGNDLTSSSVDTFSVTDLKTELTTLKSMMLNKHQFPPAPFSSSTQIPAWQKAKDTSKNDDDLESK